MTQREVDLGSAELDVLKVLWSGGPGTVRDVLRRLQEQGRKWAYTTVQTFLTRLEQKGHVVSDKSGLAHVFRARTTRERVSRSRLRALLDQLYDGSAGPLVLQLVRDERLSRDDLDELQALIERLDAKEPKRRRERS
ncbi:MAG: BlaI/MecI/CopY family transcriptional regulator [Phycisphaerales bacterium]|nr:MAG: BlaI/MecI/CopY family transcriptional regulator [Phycisphaerales bacterium]